MVIEVKQTITEVFQSLKKGILDWIPNEIMELQKNSGFMSTLTI